MPKLVKQKHWWAINQFQKWETGNPNGQPRKGISLVNKQLEEKGYSPASKQDIEANYMSMLQLWESELIELWQDKNQPMLVRILAKNMLWWKGFDIIEKMLDRWIWKSVQREERRDVDSEGNDRDSVINITINGNKDNIGILE